MNCTICKHGKTRMELVSVTLERGQTTVVFRNVPAEVCDNCGEQFVDSGTTAKLLGEAEASAQMGTEVQVRSYIAA